MNIEKEFCQYCGAHTLSKVSVYINESGQITYFKNPKRKPNLRGTKYSIPTQKTGRDAGNLILREDELFTGQNKYKVEKIRREKNKHENLIKDTLQGNYWTGGEGYGGAGSSVSNLLYENGAKGGVTGSKMVGTTTKIVIGHGKKNPNVAKH